MKRFISTLCLLVGASVASYAGPITGTGATQLLGPNAALQTFDSNATFPLGSFSSLPAFNLSGGTTNTNVTVTAGGAGSGFNQGTQGSTTSVPSAIAAYGGTTPDAVLAGQYLSSYNLGDYSNPLSFARSITFTFSGPVSEFLIDYFGSDNSTNYFIVNGVQGTQTFLSDQTCTGNGCNGSGRQAGYIAGGGGEATINSITFVMIGTDNELTAGGDVVLFDNLRVVGAAQQTTGTNPPPSGVPEPSTYAMIGAGLLALGYNRRKK